MAAPAAPYRPLPQRPVLALARVLVLVLVLLSLAVHPPPASAATISVPPGGNLQAALDTAQPGDTIVLAAGAAYIGNFVLPDKPGAEFITIRTSTGDAQLPPGERVGPAQAPLLARVLSPGRGLPAIRTAPRASHYRLIGLEVAPASREAEIFDLIALGDGTQRTLDEVPHTLVLDRMYIHTFPDTPLKRGVALNSANTDILNSYIAGFKVVGQDTQAICGWNGPGPFRITNNYLEAAGENVMFGGGVPAIPNLVPSDIELRNNDFAKPLSWREGDPAYAGTPWTVKNLFELKNAQRVILDGNRFAYNWAAAQSGFAFVFTPRSEDGAAPWAVVRDVVVTNNVVRHTGSVFNILGRDTPSPSQQTTNITIVNNLFLDVNSERWGGRGIFLQVTGSAGVVVDHNTIFHNGNLINAYGDPTTGLVFTNNIAAHNEYGIKGDSRGSGNDTLQAFFPGAVVRRNVIAGAPAARYPADNFYPASLDAVQFVNQAGGDFRLAPGSPYSGQATDGLDVGYRPPVPRENLRPTVWLPLTRR